MKAALNLFLCLLICLGGYSQSFPNSIYSTVPYEQAPIDKAYGVLVNPLSGGKISMLSRVGTNYISATKLVNVGLDQTGAVLWSNKIHITDFFYPIVSTTLSDFSVVCVGASGYGTSDIYLLKLSESGNLVWCKRIAFEGNQITFEVKTITAGTDGSFILSGEGCAGANVHVGFDKFGNCTFKKQSTCKYSGSIYYNGQLSTLYNYATNEFVSLGFGSGNIFLSRIDYKGKVILQKRIQVTGTDPSFAVFNVVIPYSILSNQNLIKDSNGDYYCSFGDNIDSSTIVVKTTSNFDVLWTRKIYSHGKFLRPVKLSLSNAGYLLLGCNFDLMNSSGSSLIIRMDRNGNLLKSNKAEAPYFSPSSCSHAMGDLFAPGINTQGFMVAVKNNFIEVTSLDTSGNTTCGFSSAQLSVKSLTSTVVEQSTSNIPRDISFNLYNVVTSVSPCPLYRYDACTLMPINPVLTSVSGLETIEQQLRLYPNPCTDHLKVEVPENETVQQVIIYEITGKELLIKGANQVNGGSVDTHLLPPGKYWMEARCTKTVYRKSFIKTE